MKKKILLMLAICAMLFALALTLAACDTDTDDSTATTTTSGTEDGGATTTTTTTTTTTAAQSIKRTYTIDGNLIATQTVPNGDTTTPHPAVPIKAHYDGVWELLSIDGNNEYYCAKYTPTNYTVTFVANGETVDTQTYTVENKSIVEPAVPDAPYGYYEIERTAWGDYTLDGGNKTVNAIYSCETQAEYALSGSTYYVSGYNYIIDGMIEILSEYKGKPVRRIGEEAFSGCTSLTSITIPSSVTDFASSAFEGCTSLNGVYISDIAAWCTNNHSYNENPLYYAHNLYLNGELVTDLVIPEGVTSIGLYAFYNCTSLKSITIPSSVTSIGYGAFEDCTSLNDVYISDIAAWCNISFGSYTANPLYDLFYNEKKLYLNGELVTDLVIPDSVTSIGKYAFRDCTSLTSVTFGENSQLTSIGDRAFNGCTSLKSVTFGENSQLTSIGERAFYWCTSLTSITIPSSVTSIGDYAFYNCTNLNGVIFKNPNGWWRSSSSTATSGTAITGLSDASTAAKYLSSTYCDYYWKRS